MGVAPLVARMLLDHDLRLDMLEDLVDPPARLSQACDGAMLGVDREYRESIPDSSSVSYPFTIAGWTACGT
jgi:hypothetical protein